MHTHIRLLLSSWVLRALRHSFAVSLSLLAQSTLSQPAPLAELPQPLAAIRATQRQLAAEADVSVTFIDTALRSASRMDGVPAEFRDEIIATEHDLIGLLERLYPYYGFTGAETLEFINGGPAFGDTAYHFRQYIDGIPTSQRFTIMVETKSRHITGFNLWLYLDRNLPRVPRMSRQQAVEVALCFVGKLGEYQIEDYDRDGAHDVEVVYETWRFGDDIALKPVWHVTLASAPGRPANEEGFAIMPGGVVNRDVMVSHSDPGQPYLCADAEAIPGGLK